MKEFKCESDNRTCFKFSEIELFDLFSFLDRMVETTKNKSIVEAFGGSGVVMHLYKTLKFNQRVNPYTKERIGTGSLEDGGRRFTLRGSSVASDVGTEENTSRTGVRFGEWVIPPAASVQDSIVLDSAEPGDDDWNNIFDLHQDDSFDEDLEEI